MFVALVRSSGLPTLADAQRAAAALREVLDPGEVLLFGSVARGEQSAGSDMDFVLVFDDLGDYSGRGDIADRARRAVLRATGFGCDVRVTDRPEWEIRSKRCRSTFEAHIAAHAVTLVSRPPRGDIDWDKDIAMAPSDAEQAARSLNNTVHALNKLVIALRSPAGGAGDSGGAEHMRTSRLLMVCEQSQIAMENSLKSLIHALEGRHPGRDHNIGDLIAQASAHLTPGAADSLRACLGPIAPKQASAWREAGTYPDDKDLDVGFDPVVVATEEFSSQMAKAATDMALYCIALIEARLGLLPPTAPPALDSIDQARQLLPIPHPGLDIPHSGLDTGL